MTTRGIRNNNPGNIRKGIDWQGVTGDDGDFSTFDTAEHGIRALAKQLIVYQSTYGLRTIRQFINRWAPPSENDTGAYVNAVAGFCGVDADAEYLLSPQGLFPLVQAIIQHENGSIPYSTEQIQTGIALAFGASEQTPADPTPVSPRSTAPLPPPADHPSTAQGRPSMFPALLIPILQALASALPVLGPLFGSGEVAKRNQAAGGVALDAAIAAVGASNAQDLLEKVQANKDVAAAAQAAILATPEIGELIEAGGGGIDGARKFALGNPNDPLPFWKQGASIVSFLLLIMGGYVVWKVLSDVNATENMKTQVVTAVLGFVGIVGAFWLGSSNGSQRKDALRQP